MSEAHWLDVMLGIFATGFIAWSGVVWVASSKALKVAESITIRVDATLESLLDRVSHLEDKLERHESQRAHEGAAADMEAIRRELDVLRNTIRYDMDALVKDLANAVRPNHSRTR